VNGTVRRRAFLLVAGLAGTTVTDALADGAGIETDPAAFLARRLQSLLFDTPAASTILPPAPTSAPDPGESTSVIRTGFRLRIDDI
jgi:hypothetical protein